MAIKLVPGGHPYHALAEAAANAARQGDIDPESVESITVSRPGMAALTGPLHPADLIDMAHSPAYFLAAGAADRDFTWTHATPQKIADPGIHRLIDKVRVGPPPTGNAARYRQGATVTIRTTDGRQVSNTVYEPKGSGMLGIDWADIDARAALRPPRAADRGKPRRNPRLPRAQRSLGANPPAAAGLALVGQLRGKFSSTMTLLLSGKNSWSIGGLAMWFSRYLMRCLSSFALIPSKSLARNAK
jgi:hypothetical protein